MSEPTQRHEHEDSTVAHEARVVAEGRAARTPFVALGGVAAVVLTFVAILTVALLLLIWALS